MKKEWEKNETDCNKYDLFVRCNHGIGFWLRGSRNSGWRGGNGPGAASRPGG
jgi:hypothetical protein